MLIFLLCSKSNLFCSSSQQTLFTRHHKFRSGELSENDDRGRRHHKKFFSFTFLFSMPTTTAADDSSSSSSLANVLMRNTSACVENDYSIFSYFLRKTHTSSKVFHNVRKIFFIIRRFYDKFWLWLSMTFANKILIKSHGLPNFEDFHWKFARLPCSSQTMLCLWWKSSFECERVFHTNTSARGV